MEYLYYLNHDCIQNFEQAMFNIYFSMLLTTKQFYQRIDYVLNLNIVVGWWWTKSMMDLPSIQTSKLKSLKINCFSYFVEIQKNTRFVNLQKLTIYANEICPEKFIRVDYQNLTYLKLNYCSYKKHGDIDLKNQTNLRCLKLKNIKIKTIDFEKIINLEYLKVHFSLKSDHYFTLSGKCNKKLTYLNLGNMNYVKLKEMDHLKKTMFSNMLVFKPIPW